MRAYEIHAKEGDMIVKRFAGSQSDATKLRMDVAEKTGIKKLSIEINEVDVPTDKVGLLGFLNTLMGG